MVVQIDVHMAATRVELTDGRFGFRNSWFTDDALRLLQDRLVVTIGKGRLAVVVSLNIRKAFNTSDGRLCARYWAYCPTFGRSLACT